MHIWDSLLYILECKGSCRLLGSDLPNQNDQNPLRDNTKIDLLLSGWEGIGENPAILNTIIFFAITMYITLLLTRYFMIHELSNFNIMKF